MSPGLAHLLMRLYPRSWRVRYGAEFEALLESEHSVLRTSANVAWSALCERILPTRSSIEEPGSFSFQVSSWCIRAPWLAFALVPVALLAGAWFLALCVLWSGWKVFLPGADTPFVPVHGFREMCYFNAGRALYFSAPVLVGWAIAFITARQKHIVAWPTIGLVLIALLGGTAQVHAGRTVVPGWVGHINMHFAFGPSVHGVPDGLLHTLVILLLSALPLFLARSRKACTLLP